MLLQALHTRTLFQLFQLLGLTGVLQGLQHIAQVAFHHGQQLVQREVDAVKKKKNK